MTSLSLRCLSYLSTPVDIFSTMSFRISDVNLLRRTCLCLIISICVRFHTVSAGYGGIVLAVLMKPSRLHGWEKSWRLILSEVICNLEDPAAIIQKHSGDKTVKYKRTDSRTFIFNTYLNQLGFLSVKCVMQLLNLTLTNLQVFVGRDPVPPHSQHTDDVMFVWEELCLLWLLLLLQTNYSNIAKYSGVKLRFHS